MFKFLSFLGGLAVVVMVLFGTWPILLGKQPVMPLVKPEKLESIKNNVADSIKNFQVD